MICRVIASIFLAFIGTALLGQVSNMPYYQKQVNKAELMIIKDKKEAALELYKSLFERVKGNFTKDVYNAMVLAAELKNVDAFYEFANLLTYKCIDKKNWERTSEFANIKDNEDVWNNFITNNTCDSYMMKLEVKNAISSIIESTNRDVRKEDSQTQLITYLVKNGFPGEQAIGVIDFNGEQILDKSLEEISKNRSLDKELADLKTILLRGILEGKIEPNKASRWIDYQNDSFKTGMLAGRLMANNNETLSSDFIVSINENRKLLHLDTLENYVLKLKWKSKNPESKYIFE